jgi:hypothetical protein
LGTATGVGIRRSVRGLYSARAIASVRSLGGIAKLLSSPTAKSRGQGKAHPAITRATAGQSGPCATWPQKPRVPTLGSARAGRRTVECSATESPVGPRWLGPPLKRNGSLGTAERPAPRRGFLVAAPDTGTANRSLDPAASSSWVPISANFMAVSAPAPAETATPTPAGHGFEGFDLSPGWPTRRTSRPATRRHSTARRRAACRYPHRGRECGMAASAWSPRSRTSTISMAMSGQKVDQVPPPAADSIVAVIAALDRDHARQGLHLSVHQCQKGTKVAPVEGGHPLMLR